MSFFFIFFLDNFFNVSGMRPPSSNNILLDPRLRSPADQMAAALRAAGPLGPPPGTSQSANMFGLPPGLAPPVSLASSVAGMDAMLAHRYLTKYIIH